MKQITEKILHYSVLLAITAAAIWVIWQVSRGAGNARQTEAGVRPLPPASAPKAPVQIAEVKPETCEILATFAGKIRPWETYSVGFEAAGRVLALGENERGEPLDDGDRVEAGQVLARLDDRVFKARRGEAAARLEQAGSDLERSQRIREVNTSAVSDSELQRLVTEQALARAQLEVATKNFEDATLRAPVAATISRRMVKAGETVGANQIVFELVQNDDVLLVLNVPESQIRELEARKRLVDQNAQNQSPGVDPEDRVFRAHVQLEGRDVFGNPWPRLDGEIYRIAEVADPRTSLFEVEVRLSNKQRLLRPGMVATAQLVVDRIEGYRLPTAAVIYRKDRAHLFTVDQHADEIEMLYWSLGPTTLYRARRVDLQQWIDQPDGVIAPTSNTQLTNVIVRGQHRLSDGQLVRPTTPPGRDEIKVAAGK